MPSETSSLLLLAVLLTTQVYASVAFTGTGLKLAVGNFNKAPLRDCCSHFRRCVVDKQNSIRGLQAKLTADSVQKFGTPSAKEASQTLVQILADGEQTRQIDREHADYLINVMVQSGSSFSGDLLSRGPFRVAYTKNSTPFWETLGRLIPMKKNDSFQDYDLSAGTLVSKAQIVGDDFCVIADADVSEADSAVTAMPKDFDVLVTGIKIKIGELQLPIPIRGVGLARMLYQDERLRIFVSPNSDSGWEEKGLIAVQVPAAQ